MAQAREGVEELLLDDLAEQSDFRIELPRLDRHETAAFVCEWLDQSNLDRGSFSRDALETVFNLSAGSPREIIRLCQLSWVAAEHDELDRIDSTTLLDVTCEMPRSEHRRSLADKSLATTW